MSFKFTRGVSRAAATSIITKRSILDVVAALDPPLFTSLSLLVTYSSI